MITNSTCTFQVQILNYHEKFFLDPHASDTSGGLYECDMETNYFQTLGGGILKRMDNGISKGISMNAIFVSDLRVDESSKVETPMKREKLKTCTKTKKLFPLKLILGDHIQMHEGVEVASK